jgi:tRNA dimethylallyltransferase
LGSYQSFEKRAHLSAPQAILIAGPTASGKSALAISAARRFGGTVINADSMQVYADLRVLSARPSASEEAQAPHLLFGHVDGAVNYSVGLFLADAARALERAAGSLPIFVGGTGMYFKALLRGLSDIPAVPDAVRESVRNWAQGRAASELHMHLSRCDPIMAARLRPSDPQRILRALEVFEATGKSLSEFQGARSKPLLASEKCVACFLDVDRQTLNARIDDRFDDMMTRGALDEARALAARDLDPMLPVMRAHGVPGLVAHLRDEISLDGAIARGKRDTRQYAKRQHTFARHQLPEFAWTSPEDAESLIDSMMREIR